MVRYDLFLAASHRGELIRHSDLWDGLTVMDTWSFDFNGGRARSVPWRRGTDDASESFVSCVVRAREVGALGVVAVWNYAVRGEFPRLYGRLALSRSGSPTFLHRFANE